MLLVAGAVVNPDSVMSADTVTVVDSIDNIRLVAVAKISTLAAAPLAFKY